MAAYTLTDRGTWLSFRNRGDFVLLVDGDSRLFDPERHPHVKAEEGWAFIYWLTSPAAPGVVARRLWCTHTTARRAPSRKPRNASETRYSASRNSVVLLAGGVMASVAGGVSASALILLARLRRKYLRVGNMRLRSA